MKAIIRSTLATGLPVGQNDPCAARHELVLAWPNGRTLGDITALHPGQRIELRDSINAVLQLAAGAAPTPDFDAVRDKRMSEMTPEQQEDAKELWVRTQILSFPAYHREFLQLLLGRLDRARTPRADQPAADAVQWWLAELDQYGNPRLVDGAHGERAGADQAKYLIDAMKLAKPGTRHAVARVELSEPRPSADGVNHEAVGLVNAARAAQAAGKGAAS